MTEQEIKRSLANWPEIVKKYQNPDNRKALVQVLNSFLPFLGLWVLMYFSVDWSLWITFALGIVNAFFLVRIFIIQHDCGHQSFLRSRKLNNAIGFVCSFFSSIPYKYWARVHSFHHGHSGQLEFRDIGNVPFLTVSEYAALPWWRKVTYRIFRSPFVLFVLAPISYLTVSNRYPFINFQGWNKVAWSQVINNILMVLVYVGLGFLLGWKAFFLVQLTILFFFGIIAFWFFFVQHQHEETYHKKKEEWDYLVASIKGATYYKLPRLFQWFTGNIGFHHIHHLSSKIPNYNLEKCARENPILNKYVTKITFWESLKCMTNKLWDEQTERMISFREYYRMKKMRAA